MIDLNVGRTACAFMASKVAQNLFLPEYVSDNVVSKRLLSPLYAIEYPRNLLLDDSGRSYPIFCIRCSGGHLGAWKNLQKIMNHVSKVGRSW